MQLFYQRETTQKHLTRSCMCVMSFDHPNTARTARRNWKTAKTMKATPTKVELALQGSLKYTNHRAAMVRFQTFW